jgi:sensor histidine kinase YesM
MITQPLIENAIIHGLASKRSDGMITLNYQYKDDVLIITVSDNGIGIFHGDQDKVDYESTGLRNIERRLKLLDDENSMEISEIEDESGEIAGTQIIQYVHLKMK